MFVRNAWYVAGWSSELNGDGFLARTLLSTPIVLWRKSDGAIVAMEDMCVHRGAPLSLGRREGDTVRCMYHGLCFDSTGKCIEVPGQDRVAPNSNVRTFPAVEQHKWLWVWMGDPSMADATAIPDTHWLDDQAWRSLEGYKHFKVNYQLLHDNLLDLSHSPYVHPTTLGGSEDFAAVLPKTEQLSNGVRISRFVHNTEPPGYAAAVKPFAGKVDRWQIYEFVVPGVFSLDAGAVPSGTSMKEGERSADGVAFHSCQAVTPETADSSHYFFCQAHNFAIDRPDITASIHKNVELAFEEDRQMISAQAARLALRPDFKMVPIRADEALGRYRWLVAKLIKQEQVNPSTATHAPGTGETR